MTSGLTFRKHGRHWARLGVRSVCSPLYSADSETHDAVVGVPGHWEQVVAGLDTAFALGLEVHVHTLAMVRTLSHLPAPSPGWVQSDEVQRCLCSDAAKKDVFRFKTAAASLDSIRLIQEPSLQWTGFPERTAQWYWPALLRDCIFVGKKLSIFRPARGALWYTPVKVSSVDMCQSLVLRSWLRNSLLTRETFEKRA